MGQDRDDYMRRQEGDHALLDMRDPARRPQAARPSVVSATTVRTETTRRVELGFTQIRLMLEAHGITLPAGARITVQVPGGGDWSNTELEVDDRCPVVVAWTEVTQS
jgi:hypothetical protein